MASQAPLVALGVEEHLKGSRLVGVPVADHRRAQGNGPPDGVVHGRVREHPPLLQRVRTVMVL